MKNWFSKLFKNIASFFKLIGVKIKELFITISEFCRLKLFVWIGTGLKFIAKYTGLLKLYNVYQKKVSNKAKKAVAGYLFILLWIVGFAIFGVYPIANSLRMALSESAIYKAIVTGDTATTVFTVQGFGLYQFKQIFSENPDDVTIILNTLLDVLIVVPLVLIFSLLLSLLLNRKVKGIKIFRMIFFIPVILLSGNLLSYFSQYNLLTVPALEGNQIQAIIEVYFPGTVTDVIIEAFGKIILILWLSGVQTLIFLAGLQKTDKPIYEAASIDGANGWEMFWKITFPSLIPLMIINIVYTTILYSNLQDEISRLITQASVSATYGRDYASALSWILFGIELVVIGFYVLILKLANRRYR